MGRAKKQVLVEIYDDLDPKSVIAWFDQTTDITYGDADGKTPAEPLKTIPIEDPETGEWVMKELWTTQENYDKTFGPVFDRLADADDAGEMAVLEKSEVDSFRERISELENELRGAKSSSGGTGTRRKYGTGPKRVGTKHIRIWLHTNGHDVSNRGRITDDLRAKYNEAYPNDDFKPNAEQEADYDAAMGITAGTPSEEGEELPFDGDNGSDSERDALSRVRGVAGAPEDAEEEEDYDDAQIKAALKEAGEKFGRNLTDSDRLKGIEIIVDKKKKAKAGAAA